MTLTADIIARIAVVVFAIIFLIAFKRRKTLFTVKNSVRVGQLHILEGIVSREIRDANLQLWLCGAIGAFALAYCIYSILVDA